MDVYHFLLFFALFFIACSSERASVSEEGKLGYRVMELNSLLPASTCSASTTKGGLQIASVYGPCSPLGQEYSTLDSSKILRKDENRVRSLNALTSNKYKTTNVQGKVTMLPLSREDIVGGNYMVKVGLGTPARYFNLIFDTGSNFPWIKCKPDSTMGFSDPTIFNTSASSTFSSSSSDLFSVTYNDNTVSKGYRARDTLTISPSDVLPNFVFGCAEEYYSTSASGLLGVGQSGSDSLISQSNTTFAKTFCYCLPASYSSTGYVLFGRRALEGCRTKKLVPLGASSDSPAYYLVSLAGISIGNLSLPFSSSVYSKRDTVLDSGTVITRLPRPVYSLLRSEFQKVMSQHRHAPPEEVLDTCYYVEKDETLRVPSMVLHFANSVDVILEESEVIWTKNGKACLAFAGNKRASDWAIIGNYQQRSRNVLYDIQNRKIGFGIGNCGK